MLSTPGLTLEVAKECSSIRSDLGFIPFVINWHLGIEPFLTCVGYASEGLR